MNADEAYARCLRQAREHYENFPVASLLVPGRMRPHIAAIYAFARCADDFADEGALLPAERLALLQSWRTRLSDAVRTPASARPLMHGEPAHTHAIFAALGHSIRHLDLPVVLFEDLLSAFEQDVHVARYQSWEDLLDYCRRSANPVGRLVLRVAGHANDDLDSLSDAVCTALQLTNFWQDFADDLARDRIYLPRSIQTHHGASEDSLDGGAAHEWRCAVADVVARTRELFTRGRALPTLLRGRLRLEIRATWLGGMRVLDRIEQSGFDPFRRPFLGTGDAAWILMRLFG